MKIQRINFQGYNRMKINRNVQLLLLVLPAFIATFIFAYIPMYGVTIAFKDFSFKAGIMSSPWVGFKHFIRFFQYPDLFTMIKNTLRLSLYSLAMFPLNVILALLLNELKNAKFKKTVQMVSYAPHFISTVVLCGMIHLFLARGNGLFNNFMAYIGSERVDFLSKPDNFAHIYVWSGVWQGIGWGSIIYLAALAGVSPELIDSARIDGANRVQVIEHINIPCIMPTIVIMFILNSGYIMNIGFEKILLLQNDLNRTASRVIQTYVYQIGVLGGDFSYTAAIGLFNNIINIIILLIVNKTARELAGVGIW